MRLEPQRLAGLYLLVPEPIVDERGFFARVFDASLAAGVGLVTTFPEWSISYNRQRGTLRGMHWQGAPHGEAKIVRCLRGAVFDAVVDLRRSSPSFGCWLGFTLDAANRHALYVPVGFAHGFQSLVDDTELHYHISTPYIAAASRGLRWNDPRVAIAWPLAETSLLSQRDSVLPLLEELKPDEIF